MKRYVPLLGGCVLMGFSLFCAFAADAKVISFADVCAMGTLQEVQCSFQLGANANERDEEGFTPLMFASIVRELIREGAEVNAADMWGFTPLVYAAGDNMDTGVITLLLRHGADVRPADLFGNTALMYAAMNNRNPDVIRRLVRAGSDVNARNLDGYTALELAAVHGNKIAEEILKK